MSNLSMQGTSVLKSLEITDMDKELNEVIDIIMYGLAQPELSNKK